MVKRIRITAVTVGEQLTEDMKVSMRAGETGRTGALRLLKSALKNEEIRAGHPLDNDEALKVLKREAKQRRDSIEAYKSAGRQDLVQAEELELRVIESYLPKAMSDVEVGRVVDEVIAGLGAAEPKQTGAIIGAVMKKVGTTADGGTVSRLVREKLAS